MNSPIWYIPKKDTVQEALEKNKKTNYFKLMLLHRGGELKVALWASETPEQFILHVRSVIHACKQMEHDVKFLNAKEAVAMARMDLEIKKEENGQVCNSERKKNTVDPGEGVPPASEPLVDAKSAYKKQNRL